MPGLAGQPQTTWGYEEGNGGAGMLRRGNLVINQKNNGSSCIRAYGLRWISGRRVRYGCGS